MKKFTSYLNNGEIHEAPSLKTVYESARYLIRDDVDGSTAAIICGMSGKPFVYMLRKFGVFHIYRYDDIPNFLLEILKQEFQRDKWARACWHMANNEGV